MCPITVGSADVYTVSINYSFVLCPLAILACTGKLQRPPDIYLQFMSFYILIFAVATLYQFELTSALDRRATSFILFMSMFSFMFIKIDEGMFDAFKASVVVAASVFSLVSVYIFFANGGAALGYNAKEIVGSQRYGFIYVMAFWLLYLSAPKAMAAKITKGLLILIVITGLMLTFSRASIVALLVSVAIFLVRSLRGITVGRLMKATVIAFVGGAVTLYVLYSFFPIIFVFFNDRLFEFLLNQNKITSHLANSETSEGARLLVWGGIANYILTNPFTGAGYLGVWIIKDVTVLASAHNQYLDVLFRTGVGGFFIHLVLLYWTANFLWHRDKGLFWGFVGVLVYGLFHETFKESQGGFLLAFLLGAMSQSNATGRRLRYYGRLPNDFSPSSA